METKITKLSQISNVIFFVSAVYFLNFLWLEYYLHSIKKAFWLSFLTTAIASTIVYFIKKYFGSKKKSQTLVAKEKEILKTQLIWGNEDEISKYLMELFELKPTKIANSNHYVLSDKSEVFFNFNPSGLDIENLSKIIRCSHSSKVTIFCVSHIPFCKISNKEITLITLEEIYSRQKKLSSQIVTNITIENKAKYSLKTILCIALNKNRTKNYFWSSILLIFMSLFTPYNVYYLIVSTALMLLSIYSRFNTRFNS